MVSEYGEAKIIDIEAKGLLSDLVDFSSFPYKLRVDAELWCISIRDLFTDTVISLSGSELTKDRLKKELKGCKYLIHHNGIKYDLITLSLFGILEYTIGYPGKSDTLYGEDVTMVDTIILSRLLSPDRYGGHSLKEWGLRTGYSKTDFRQVCIDKGIIDKGSPKGSEFNQFCSEMIAYCEDDTMVTKNTFEQLVSDMGDYTGWKQAIKMENKLADLAVKRESIGFWFDKEAAIAAVDDLTLKMIELQDKVNPILPPKPMTKGELDEFTAPATQFLKSGKPSSHIVKFATRIGGFIEESTDSEDVSTYYINFENKRYPLPHNLPLKTHVEADISNLDHVKMTLTDVYNWIPTEWAFRDFTKDSKKQSLPYEKRVIAFERWLSETISGKYKTLRLKSAFTTHKVNTVEGLKDKILEKLNNDYPVRLNTSPKVRVGVEKELCPNLLKLGDDVEFAKDFALFLTYKHRKSCIAGGELEDVDYDEEYPLTGYLSAYRESDGRVPTPAIEIGASTSRYRHILVTNVARGSSVYGKEMRSLFGCGEGFVQLGFDFSSLEARIQGHYVFKYPEGEELSKSLIAEKPDDIHCYSEDTEILTIEGWKTFNNVTRNTLVAQYNPETKKSEWVTPSEVIWEDYKGDMISIKGSNTDQLLTPNHRVYTEDIKDNNGKIDLAKDLLNVSYTNRRFLCGAEIEAGETIQNEFLQLLVAVQADGTLQKDCSGIIFTFTKNRKIKRLKELVSKLGMKYSTSTFERKGREETVIRLSSSEDTVKIRQWLGLNKELLPNILKLSSVSRKVVLDEIVFWDGTQAQSGVVLDTTCESTVNILQSICTSLGVKSTVTYFEKHTTYGDCNIIRLFISERVKAVCGVYGTVKKVVKYEGKVGCVTVPSSLVVVRRNGKVFVSGNSVNSRKLGIERSIVKSVAYAILYGCSPKKLEEMLGYTPEEAKSFYDNYWDAVPALRDLKIAIEAFWETNGKNWLPGIDGRKLNTRSKHSLINLLFQSCGVIAAKYVTVSLIEDMEEQGYCTDPFKGRPDVCSMIEYHDEVQLLTSPRLHKFKIFDTEDMAEDFVKNWDKSAGQISTVGHSNKGYYVSLPNPVSIGIEKAIRKTEELLKIQVPLGFEWITGKNWYQCH